MRTLVNVLLFVVLVGLLSLNFLFRVDPSRRNIDVLPDMASSVAYDSYAGNPNFADGKTLREPVPGTVVRGLLPLRYAPTAAGAQQAGRELAAPVNPNALQRGAVVYANYCETCHGPAGKGDGRVAQRGFPAPPSLLAPKALQLADGQMFHILAFGQGNMPSYAAQIDRGDRWAAIAYVRELQRAAARTEPPQQGPPVLSSAAAPSKAAPPLPGAS
jgi:mono/diheme cytochrome c family protein